MLTLITVSIDSSLSNIFVIGEGNKPLVSLPKGKGVKLSIAGAYRLWVLLQRP